MRIGDLCRRAVVTGGGAERKPLGIVTEKIDIDWSGT